MRKILLPICLLTGIVSFGQAPILTTGHINGIGESMTYFVADSNANNLDAVTGVGITWDYSALQGYTTTVDNNILDATTAANAADFPSSVFADELQGNFVIYENRVVDSILAQGYTFSEPSVGDVLVLLSSDELKIMQYPFTYLDSYTDSLSGTVDITGGFPLSGDYEGSVTVSADGYGTFLLGTTTYSDVLRVKIVETSVADLGLLGIIPLIRTQYNYYQPSAQNFPIFMHTSLDAAGTVQNIVYSQDLLSIIGVEEQNQSMNISVYPNPTTENLMIQLNSSVEINASIVVKDIIGKTIEGKNVQLSKGTNIVSFDLSNLIAGIYLVKIDSGTSQITKKIVVK